MTGFRPRFSVRSLAIVVTLICVYLGAWDATQKYGVETIQSQFSLPIGHCTTLNQNYSPAPLILARQECDWVVVFGELPETQNRCWRYYVWLFGLKIKLPFESQVTS